MNVRWTGILILAVLNTPMANAVDWSAVTEQESKKLPNICILKYRAQQGDAGAKKEGLATIGPQFNNAHHYCNGLNFMNRYYQNAGRRDAKSYLSFARDEFNYMVKHMAPQSPLGAEIFLNRGIVHSLLGNDANAMSDLQRALSLDPKLARTYITLADQYTKLKSRDRALDVVTDGLRYIPDNRALKRRYDELGGKQPYPEPLIASNPTTPFVGEPQEKAEASVTMQQSGDPEKVVDEASSKVVEKQGEDATPIGSPTNPYCRFCPD